MWTVAEGGRGVLGAQTWWLTGRSIWITELFANPISQTHHDDRFSSRHASTDGVTLPRHFKF